MTPPTAKFINPFTDFGFKKLFGEEPNKDLLIDFLNELLQDEQGKIVDMTYLNNERLGRIPSDKKVFFDLYCTNEYGEKFIVELQRTWQRYFKDRTVYYATFPISEQGQQGDWDYELKSVYIIAILDFTFDEEVQDPSKYRYDVKLLDTDTGKVFYDKLKFIYLEMPKFNKGVEELGNHFEKWMYILKHLHMLEKIPAALQEKIFNKVFTVAEIANFSLEEERAYRNSLKDYRDYTNVIDSAKRQSKEEGLQQGLQQGAENRSMEIAKNLLQQGFEVGFIEKVTGLSKEIIKQL